MLKRLRSFWEGIIPSSASVVEGAKRGNALLGFPTANLAISEEVYPKAGVYAVEVLWNRRAFNGVANIGVNPTFQPAHPGMKRRSLSRSTS